MGVESPEPPSTLTGAVFLSYASQDADAARRICDALRAAGIEVWFDQSDLRGGDAWDRKIRDRIHDCRLFIPVISASTERRDEGYFRREWAFAADRTRDMAHKRAFLVPVVVDGTSERGASVPDKFNELQWTRLPGGDTPPRVC
jgi:TIR domain